MTAKVLVASPVRQRENILKEFLESLEKLDTAGVDLAFAFIDDNNQHKLLRQFQQRIGNVRVFQEKSQDNYHCDEKTHYWQEELIWKVAGFKNRLIKLALEENFDYLFLVDSDLYLHPKTIKHLIEVQKDIVSEVFWTKWNPDLIPLPQVWVSDHYQLYSAKRQENLSEEEVNQRTRDFINMLSRPGTYKVGGLGACTLINRKALLKGVSFDEIYNLSLWGEDRHFCIRAVALGLELYADTYYPPFHIYRQSDLEQLQEYKKSIVKAKVSTKQTAKSKKKAMGSRITLAMLVRNEAQRYLKEVLEQGKEYADRVAILDDASDDDTAELCKGILGKKLTLVSNDQPCFHNEIVLRKQLWDLALSTKPDWIMILDADEIFETCAPGELRQLAENKDAYYYSFRLYDMWNETHFREDSYWSAHRIYRPFMVRYVPGFNYRWQETPLHCGRFPLNITDFKGLDSQLRIKHLGWVKSEDRLKKYYRYKELDPRGLYGISEQYESILDPLPRLVPWEE